jgi:hypothetical protein
LVVTLQQIPVDLIQLVAIRGLDPRIHHLRKAYAKRRDPRVKPVGDGSGGATADSNRPGTAVALALILVMERYRICRGALS